jgi:hypothetical protein
VLISGEMLTDGFVVEVGSIQVWGGGLPIHQSARALIVNRIERALRSQGMAVDLG